MGNTNTAKLDADKVLKSLHAAYCRDVPRKELLRMTASKLREAGSPYTGVYLYMVHDDNLVLEAFDGRPTEHQTIPVGKGLCGRAVAEARDLNVADVNSDSDYLACSAETQSELIVLIRQDDEIIGQIDIDSDQLNGFDQREYEAVKRVADGLAALL